MRRRSFSCLAALFIMICSFSLLACNTIPHLPSPQETIDKEPNPDEPNPDEPNPDEPNPDEPNPDEPSPDEPGETKTLLYQKDNSDFANPERGVMLKLLSSSTHPTPLAPWDFKNLKAVNGTVIQRVYNLSSFRSKAISKSFLDHIQNDFNLARQNGAKLVLHFAYNYNDGSKEDAPLNVVLEHIDQLAPLLERNVDVIAYVDGGFIGQWGEWHSSSHDLNSDANKKRILEALLKALPVERHVVIRYLKDKQIIFATENPLPQTQAYSGSDRARTGHKNNCFLADVDDYGTYTYPYTEANLNAQKNYLSAENLFLPQAGETCFYNPPRSDCPTALAEMRRMRWSNFNAPDNATIRAWKNQGCYATISKSLGYRYHLIEATLPVRVSAGSSLLTKFTMANDGYANAYNPRMIELVLRHQISGKETHLVFNPTMDERLFLPAPGQTKILDLNVNLPATLAEGDYDLFLNLPDPASNLYGKAAYSIRLANQDTWEASSGYNKLSSLKVQ